MEGMRVYIFSLCRILWMTRAYEMSLRAQRLLRIHIDFESVYEDGIEVIM